MTRFAGLLVAALTALWLVSALVAQGPADKFIPVTQKKDLNDPDPADWLMLGGNMEHWNYSRLDQINGRNIGDLQLVWARQLPTTGDRAGTSLLIHNGIMYLIRPERCHSCGGRPDRQRHLGVSALTSRDRKWPGRDPSPLLRREAWPRPLRRQNLHRDIG